MKKTDLVFGFVLIILLAMSINLTAQISWTGTTDSDWGNSTNWFFGEVPGPGDNVLIPNVTNDPIISTSVEINQLFIFPDAQLTVGPNQAAGLTTNGMFTNNGLFLIQSDDVNGYSGTFIDNAGIAGTGTFEFERMVLCTGTTAGSADTNWHYLAAPIDGFTSDDIPDFFINAWDQPDGEWTQYSSSIQCTPWPTTPLNTMDAWSINSDNDYPGDCTELPPGTNTTATFTGSAADVHTGNYSTPLGFGDDNQKWNLVGNPYPSGLDLSTITWGSSTVQAVHFYDGCSGSYVSWTPDMGSYVMAPTLGFFVETTGPDNFSVTNANRAHSSDWFWKSEEITNLLTLEATGNDKSDVLHIRFKDNVTAGFDLNGDAHKLITHTEGLPQIYTFVGEEILAINALPATDTVPMGFTAVGSGMFTIKAIETSDFTDIELEDLFNGMRTDLLTSSYTFKYTDGDNHERFIVHFNKHIEKK